MVETERPTQRRVEDLIATSLYRARINKIRDYLKKSYRRYDPYLKPIGEVREILAKEMPEESLSQEVVDLRRRETH